MKAVSYNPRNGGTQKGLVPGAFWASLGTLKSHSCRAPPRFYGGGVVVMGRSGSTRASPLAAISVWTWAGHRSGRRLESTGLGDLLPAGTSSIGALPALRNSRELSIPLACHIQHRS